ncbi:MAG: hypothetical protein M3Z32_08615 [Acidobacteriota bacterium]|nr:hypothetical protein [Acidobacteriota bacterium]
MVACAALLFANVGSANDKKLTQEDRVEILRGLMAEYATVKSYLPRSKKPLVFHSNGTWDKQKWQEQGRELGPAARVGDLVQITRVTIEDDKILLEINNGIKKGGHWYDHVEVGMGNRTSPINGSQNSAAPGGTYIALLFDQPTPALKSSELKKMLTPVLDFEKHSATENYVEKLPEPVQKAIKANKAIEGMDREQVLLALGKPRHKERDVREGSEMEDWIYGQPPGKITFVTFNGSKVVKVKDAYADVGGSTAAPLPPR